MEKETNPFLKEKKDEKKIDETYEKEKTMKLSIKEGAVSTVMSSFGDAYITPYALSLNANNVQIGLLSSLTGLIGPLAQIKGSKLMEKLPRKKIVVIGTALNAIMWIPILILAFLFQKGMYLEYLPLALIVFYSIYAIFGAIGGPAWFSMLGDIVPNKIRGKYFGKRNRVAGIVGLITTLGAAFLLDLFKTKGIVLLGFALLFFVAFVFRLVSAYLFTKHYDPKLHLEDGYYFSFWDFIKKAPKNNFGRFTIYIALMYFGVQIGGPFFAVYMLKDLNFSYMTYTLVNISSTVFALITMGIWGKFSDKYGNRKILAICGFVIPFLPIAWIFSPSPIYLMFVPQLIGGIGWAGFNLAVSNFIYDAVTPARRAICVAYLNLMVGIGLFLGGIVGGFMAHFMTINFMNKLLFIFLISGVVRLLASLIFIPMIKEVKEVHELKHPFVLLKQFEFILGGIFEIVNIFRIKKKVKKH
jgi:MFS family permease